VQHSREPPWRSQALTLRPSPLRAMQRQERLCSSRLRFLLRNTRFLRIRQLEENRRFGGLLFLPLRPRSFHLGTVPLPVFSLRRPQAAPEPWSLSLALQLLPNGQQHFP